MNYKILITTIFGLASLVAAAPANAQQSQINTKARQKADFYNAPRRIQIVDERPIISDFREAPVAQQQIQLPPGPQGYGPGGGGGQGGMQNGQPMQLPAGPGMLPYRTQPNNLNSLPKVGFGNWSNIPQRGMGPQGALPSGRSSGGHVAMPPMARPPQQTAAGPRPGGQRPIAASRPAGSPVAAGYGGNYTQSPGGTNTGVAGSVASTAVRARLINRLK